MVLFQQPDIGHVSEVEQERRIVELFKCQLSREYFINEYCQIYDSVTRRWIPFKLWRGQNIALKQYDEAQLHIWLKARQIGFSWLAVAIAAHSMLFEPIATWLMFSKREDESIYQMSHDRLRGMFSRLPEWMLPAYEIDDKKHLRLANGSSIRAFPTNGGDSYTATGAIVDEADLVPDLFNLLSRVAPTIDAGGKLMLISRADKDRPQSDFKKIFRAAMSGDNDYRHLFLAWFERPDRNEAWYEKQKRNAMSNTGSLDEVYEQYPATVDEALSERTLKQRIPYRWLERIYQKDYPTLPLEDYEDAIDIPGLIVYELPQEQHTYTIGVDTSEGIEDRDEMCATVLCAETGDEVAHLSGIIELEIAGDYMVDLATWYNYARVMVERNNHGHTMLAHLNGSGAVNVAEGHDDKDGWLSNAKGKVMMYKIGAENIRDQNVNVRTPKTRTQLGSIQRGTLRAPPTLHDDCADSYVLAVACLDTEFEVWSMAV